MFFNIIFLILVLLLVSFSPMANGNGWFTSPWEAFGIGMVVYGVVLGIIAAQNKLLKETLRSHRNLFLGVVNIDLLAFFAFFHFILAGNRVFPNSSGLIAAFSLLLYLGGLYVFHLTAYSYLPSSRRGAVGTAREYAAMELRFIFPFALPFLIFSFLIDTLSLFPGSDFYKAMHNNDEDVSGLMLLFVVTAVFLVGTMVFFPPLIQSIWKCKPITNTELRNRLEAICQRAKFRHSGIKTWTIMNHSYTAGIIGIVPRFRYVMFTKRLLNELPKESIEAILAHEIGHSYRKHLLIYPFIIFGMIVATAVFSLFFSESINEYFTLQDMLRPSPLWKTLYPLSLFIPYAVIIAVYFRYVFGYFSRLFERQADLHVFELGIPPEHMHQALDELGRVTGNTHYHPSWHHHSIIDRMEFLERAAENPGLVQKHHRRVKRNLFVYGMVLLFFSSLVISPLMPDITPFRQLAAFSEKTSSALSDGVSRGLHGKIVEQYINTYGLKGDTEVIRETLSQNVKRYSSIAREGVVEFLTARDLYEKGEYAASAQLMTATWNSMDEKLAVPEVLEDFSLLSDRIIQQYHGPEAEELDRAYEKALTKWRQREDDDIRP